MPKNGLERYGNQFLGLKNCKIIGFFYGQICGQQACKFVVKNSVLVIKHAGFCGQIYGQPNQMPLYTGF